MIIDLHMHSAASDGEFPPAELMAFAARQGVQCLALTDHDTVLGNAEAQKAAQTLGMRFIPGIEVSCTYATKCIHVVGLNIDCDNPTLKALNLETSRLRAERLVKLGDRLAQLGYAGVAERALALAPNKEIVSRMHFARALVAMGACRDLDDAFGRLIGENCPGYVPTAWPALSRVIEWIHAAGGVAVLAHPGRYRFEALWQTEELVRAFKEAGGDAVEVVSGSQAAHYTEHAARWAKFYGLAASRGSDFHCVSGMRPLPGGIAPLPPGLTSVLELL